MWLRESPKWKLDHIRDEAISRGSPGLQEVWIYSQSRKLDLVSVNPGLAGREKKIMCFGFTLISVSSLINFCQFC